MPTVSQLIRKGRRRKLKKIKAAALRKLYSTKERRVRALVDHPLLVSVGDRVRLYVGNGKMTINSLKTS